MVLLFSFVMEASPRSPVTRICCPSVMHHCSSSGSEWVNRAVSQPSASQPSVLCHAAAFRHNMKWPYNLWLPLMQQELQVVLYIHMYVVYLVASVAHEVPVIPWSHPFFLFGPWLGILFLAFWLFVQVIRCRLTALNCCMPETLQWSFKVPKPHVWEFMSMGVPSKCFPQ